MVIIPVPELINYLKVGYWVVFLSLVSVDPAGFLDLLIFSVIEVTVKYPDAGPIHVDALGLHIGLHAFLLCVLNSTFEVLHGKSTGFGCSFINAYTSSML